MRKFNITVVLKNHLHLENEISMFFIVRVITYQYFVWMKFKITMQNTSNWFMANFKFELPGLLVRVSITCLTILVVLTIFWRSSMIFCIILTAFSMFLTQLWTMFLVSTDAKIPQTLSYYGFPDETVPFNIRFICKNTGFKGPTLYCY